MASLTCINILLDILIPPLKQLPNVSEPLKIAVILKRKMSVKPYKLKVNVSTSFTYGNLITQFGSLCCYVLTIYKG